MPEVTLHGPRRGLKDYVNGTPGFYIVNPRTNISNHRRFGTKREAEANLRHLEAKLDSDPGVQVVVEIGGPHA